MEQRLEKMREKKGPKSARNLNKDLVISPRCNNKWVKQQLILAKKQQKKREALRDLKERMEQQECTFQPMRTHRTNHSSETVKRAEILSHRTNKSMT